MPCFRWSETLKGFLKQSNATHLLLITKHRGETYFPKVNGFHGSGKLHGLGFFVDLITPLIIPETGKMGAGFLAPYAYITVSVVDAETASIVSQKSIKQTSVWSGAHTGALNAWDGLTAAQKLKALQDTVRDAVVSGLPGVLETQVR